MRFFFCVFHIVVLLTTDIVSAQENPEKLVMSQDKTNLSKELVQLRDSIDNSLLELQKKLSSNKTSSKEQLHKAYNDLSLQSSEIENMIEELVNTNEQAWTNLKVKAFAQTKEKRIAYYQILNDIKNISESKSYQ